ncbi:MAG: OmpA family protein [Elusimicrobia bacterium]|nr:OmpA family protein [Elusimicrobiota bacterium]
MPFRLNTLPVAAALWAALWACGCASSAGAQRTQTLENQVQALQAELRQAKENGAKEVKQAAQGKASLAFLLEDAKATIKVMEQRVRQLERSNQTLQNLPVNSKKDARGEIAKLSKEIDALGKAKTDLYDRLSKQVLRKKELQEELDAQKKENRSLANKLFVVEISQDRLQKQLAQAPADASQPVPAAPTDASAASSKASVPDDTDAPAEPVTDPLLKELESLEKDLSKELSGDAVQITQTPKSLILSVPSDALFDAGAKVDAKTRLEIKAAGQKTLKKVAAAMKKISERPVRVEANTDNSPVSWNAVNRYSSLWDYSAACATLVAEYLSREGGINPRMLSAVGYGEHRPLESNATAEGRQVNRRIEIVLDTAGAADLPFSPPEP